MLFDERAVRENLRNRDGKRVFYLGKGDQLTSAARDWLLKERVDILPADQAKPDRYRLLSGGFLEEKPEHMTHLSGDILVEKTHPRIAFRGKLDTLEGELLLAIHSAPQLKGKLEDILALAREIMACDVLEKPLNRDSLCGMTEAELRRRSHFPQEYYGQPHFMPSAEDGINVLLLNRLRCTVRETELAAARAYPGSTRTDLLRALNRMSSTVYLLMIEQKGRQQ